MTKKLDDFGFKNPAESFKQNQKCSLCDQQMDSKDYAGKRRHESNHNKPVIWITVWK